VVVVSPGIRGKELESRQGRELPTQLHVL
jgi:hypothetical protein